MDHFKNVNHAVRWKLADGQITVGHCKNCGYFCAFCTVIDCSTFCIGSMFTTETEAIAHADHHARTAHGMHA